MKLYKSLILGSAALLGASMVSCSEDATLEGANVVYIEMTPSNISMTVGDTVTVSARVSNESGDNIDTPIAWTVDDPQSVRIYDVYTAYVNGRARKKYRYVPVENAAVAALSRADEGTDTAATDTTAAPDPKPAPDTTWVKSSTAIVSQLGSQGKTTTLRATLQNGQYAIAPVSIMARSLNKAVAALTQKKRSYQRNINDTVWFSVTPFQLVDEAELSFEMRLTKIYAGPNKEEDKNFEYEHENMADNIYIDRENKRVGVVYTGPRLAGQAECELTLSDGSSSSSAVVPIFIFPSISPGFELQNGHRPLPAPPTPSNPKQTLMNATMDINSTYDLGACLGVDFGQQYDIDYVQEMERQGLLTWEVEGSAVVVEDLYMDRDYPKGELSQGYVSYIRLRSGAREGRARVIFTMPDTTMVCNLTVENYNVSHPVEKIVVSDRGNEINYQEGVSFAYGSPATLEISVEPEASYSFHIPEVTSSDPSVIEVNPITEGAGYTRSFTLHKLGSAVITVTSLDKTISFPVTVKDQVEIITWETGTSEFFMGSVVPLKVNVRMATGSAPFGNIKWIVGDESIISVVNDPSVFGQATMTALAEGTTTVICEVDGVSSEPKTITIKPASDILASGYDERYIYDNGDGTWGLEMYGSGPDISIFFPYEGEDLASGHYAGSGASVWIGGEENPGDVSFDINVVNNGDGTYSITGTFTLANGTRIIFNGETIQM